MTKSALAPFSGISTGPSGGLRTQIIYFSGQKFNKGVTAFRVPFPNLWMDKDASTNVNDEHQVIALFDYTIETMAFTNEIPAGVGNDIIFTLRVGKVDIAATLTIKSTLATAISTPGFMGSQLDQLSCKGAVAIDLGADMQDFSLACLLRERIP